MLLLVPLKTVKESLFQTEFQVVDIVVNLSGLGHGNTDQLDLDQSARTVR